MYRYQINYITISITIIIHIDESLQSNNKQTNENSKIKYTNYNNWRIVTDRHSTVQTTKNKQERFTEGGMLDRSRNNRCGCYLSKRSISARARPATFSLSFWQWTKKKLGYFVVRLSISSVWCCAVLLMMDMRIRLYISLVWKEKENSYNSVKNIAAEL